MQVNETTGVESGVIVEDSRLLEGAPGKTQDKTQKTVSIEIEVDLIGYIHVSDIDPQIVNILAFSLAVIHYSLGSRPSSCMLGGCC